MADHLANDTEHTGSQSVCQSSPERDHASMYGLQLSDDELRNLVAILGETSLHYVVGFVTGAVSIPEPLPSGSCLKLLIAPGNESVFGVCDAEVELADEPEQDLPAGPADVLFTALYDRVQQRVGQDAVASLLPSAADAYASDQWIAGLETAANTTSHDLTDAEAEICLRLFARPDDRTPLAQRRAHARKSLAADVPRLLQLWMEVPPYDPALDDEPLPRPKALVPAESREKVAHSGGTFVRTQPKVGRNDLCPCGSGKKFKKCCG